MKFEITDIILKICVYLVESKNQEIDIKLVTGLYYCKLSASSQAMIRQFL